MRPHWGGSDVEQNVTENPVLGGRGEKCGPDVLVCPIILRQGSADNDSSLQYC